MSELSVLHRMLSFTKMSPFWPGGLLLLLVAITRLLVSNADSIAGAVITDAPAGGVGPPVF